MQPPPSTSGRSKTWRRRLLEKRAELLRGFAPRADAASRRDDLSEEDQAQLFHDEFVTLQLNSLDYVQLRLIDEALDRLGSGHYGICLGCEHSIPRKRLAALPWARYCVACQQDVGIQREREILGGRPRLSPPRP